MKFEPVSFGLCCVLGWVAGIQAYQEDWSVFTVAIVAMVVVAFVGPYVKFRMKARRSSIRKKGVTNDWGYLGISDELVQEHSDPSVADVRFEEPPEELRERAIQAMIKEGKRRREK